MTGGKLRSTIAMMILLMSAMVASAQTFSNEPERLIIGGQAGFFRISFDGFTRIYHERSGLTTGAAGMVKVFSPYYLLVKYHHFTKDGAVIVENTVQPQHWREDWYNLGVRYLARDARKVSSYFGFGFAFFTINETGNLSIFGREPGKRNASGFFLDGGLQYRFLKHASLCLELEMTSAGVEGKSGFEGSSVGGFLIGIGANFFIL
ncbi:MAG: hypothetical protein ONB44_17445 [candidate division KSB1 bacterium]|nr:hypothetical protein [candidate division KSB1 bacterium]